MVLIHQYLINEGERMARPSKGKKAIKSQQKTARPEKTAQIAPETAIKTEPLAQTTQAVQAEKPKNTLQKADPKKTDVPETVEPAVPVTLTDRAITFIKSNFTICTVVVVLLMAFMLYIRTVPSHDLVFTNWPWINGGTYVNVAEDDGVYHMRLLDNTLQHFPFRILYDPFTHFPYGNTIHFGPLFELIPAAFLLIIGLGHPSQMLVDTVAAYFPAVLGMLVAVPTYYIGKKLFGKPAGIIAALTLAFMGGNFFWRSMLGSTDHHVAEVLFMACSVACLIYALDYAKSSKLNLDQLKSRDWNAFKLPVIYAAFAGLFMGCYILSWVGGLLLAFTVFLYITIQAVIEHYNGRSLDHLIIIGALFFVIPTIMVLPYSMSNLSFDQVHYSITQPLLLIGAFAGICIEYALSTVLRQNKAEKWAFPVTIVGAGVIGVLLLFLVVPGLFGIIQFSLNELVPSGGLLTVEEAYPTLIDRSTGAITLAPLWQLFFWAFPAALIGLVMLIFRVLKSRRPAEVMFLIWNLVMVWAMIAQNRFTYYFAVNVALLTAYLAAEMLSMLNIDELVANFRKKAATVDNFQRFVKKNMGSCIGVAVVLLIFVFIAVYPVLPMSDYTGNNQQGVLFEWASAGPAIIPHDWYDALMWMRGHTPDPQGSPISASFDFNNGQYYKNNSGPRYDYPSSAYGVMSWWDYGHDIEYIAARIPNANPFQAGIIEENGTTGAAPYFLSTDEATSVNMLNEVGARYVVIDNQMATGKFGAIEQWTGDTTGWEQLNQSTYVYSDPSGTGSYMTDNTVNILQDSSKWNNSTINRLYYDDCNGMSHYRLVYESNGSYYVDIRFVDSTYGAGWWPPSGANPPSFDTLAQANATYQMYSNYVIASDSQASRYLYGARPPVKWVKVFEKVAGATLTGSAPDGSSVTAMLTLKTDGGREFNYTATTVAQNGAYSFTVPYPTEQMKGNGYSYGIMPETKYAITFGNTTKTVDVPESAVMNGDTISIT